MSRSLLLSLNLTVLGALLLTACDGTPPLKDASCEDECAPGARECVSDNAWRACDNYDADPCLEWQTEPTLCPLLTTCDSVTTSCVAACADECTLNERRCVIGVNAYQVCTDSDGDSCLDWGTPVPCQGSDTCQDGQCGSHCISQCVLDARICATATSYQVCIDPGDGCLEYGSTQACGGTLVCQGGQCLDPAQPCTSECVAGSRTCGPDNSFLECGDHDADTCVEWGDPNPCPPQTTCSGGECRTGCSNECAPLGSTECSGNGYRTCGEYGDGDPCLEWSSVVPCPVSCFNGQCTTDACSDLCATTGARTCSGDGTGYLVCGDYNSDGCKEWSSAPVACPTGKLCYDGVCGCSCDYYPGVCEAAAVGSTAECLCDPDCAGTATACGDDDHCDTWCPAGVDPDCGGTVCSCDYNAYCEPKCNYKSYPTTCGLAAITTKAEMNCACDPNCSAHRVACMDDGHSDSWCPRASQSLTLTDPDFGRDACLPRTVWMGWYWGDDPEWILEGTYELGDNHELILGPPNLTSGSAEIFFQLPGQRQDCWDELRVWVRGWNACPTGDGAEVFFWNYETGKYDEQPVTVDGASASDYWTHNKILASAFGKHLSCYTPAGGQDNDEVCYLWVKISDSIWDCTHLTHIQLDIKF